MEKNIRIGSLLDIYGELLSTKQRELIDLACNEDLSLSEIAETSGLTRQGVHDSIRRGELQLESYEQKLGLYERHAARIAALEALLKHLQSAKDALTEDAQAKEDIIKAYEIALQLLQKEE